MTTILKEITALCVVETFNDAQKIYSAVSPQHLKLKSMFCPKVSTYSTWCRDISYLGLPNDSYVAEFGFLVQGDHVVETVMDYLHGFGVNVLEVWS